MVAFVQGSLLSDAGYSGKHGTFKASLGPTRGLGSCGGGHVASQRGWCGLQHGGTRAGAGSEALAMSYCQVVSALERYQGWVEGVVQSTSAPSPGCLLSARDGLARRSSAFTSPHAALGDRVQLVTPFLVPISQAGLWRAALSHPSSPTCVKSCESRLQEQTRPRAFLAFSFFSSPRCA